MECSEPVFFSWSSCHDFELCKLSVQLCIDQWALHVRQADYCVCIYYEVGVNSGVFYRVFNGCSHVPQVLVMRLKRDKRCIR